MKNAVVKREVAPAAIQGGKVDFGEVLVGGTAYPTNPEDVAARVRSHLAAAALLGRMSLAHAIAAGWLLHHQKIHTSYGEWGKWCGDALGVSQTTAGNYIGLFLATVGNARRKDGVPLENYITPRELEFATSGMEDKSATRAMIDLGVVKRNPGHGGAREGAGRQAKDPAAEVAAAASDPDLNWAEVSGYLKGLYDFSLDGDGFGALADDDLESAVAILTEVAERAKALLKARREGGAE